MKRLLVTATLALVLAGCGGGEETAATVAGETISTAQVEAVLEHAKEEFDREGKQFPEPGTAEYRDLRNQALALLVYREELVQSAYVFGISVDERQVEEGLRASRGSEQGEEREQEGSENPAFRAGGLREAILYRRIYARVTRDLRVGPGQVERYYERHRARYLGQGRTLGEARSEIARDLLVAAKNARMARWVTAMKRSFTAKVVYGKGFSLPNR
jgi:hypothetical protein